MAPPDWQVIRYAGFPLLIGGIATVIYQRSNNIRKAAASVAWHSAPDIDTEIGRLFRHEIGKEMMLIATALLLWPLSSPGSNMLAPIALLFTIGLGLWLWARHFTARRTT